MSETTTPESIASKEEAVLFISIHIQMARKIVVKKVGSKYQGEATYTDPK